VNLLHGTPQFVAVTATVVHLCHALPTSARAVQRHGISFPLSTAAVDPNGSEAVEPPDAVQRATHPAAL